MSARRLQVCLFAMPFLAAGVLYGLAELLDVVLEHPTARLATGWTCIAVLLYLLWRVAGIAARKFPCHSTENNYSDGT